MFCFQGGSVGVLHLAICINIGLKKNTQKIKNKSTCTRLFVWCRLPFYGRFFDNGFQNSGLVLQIPFPFKKKSKEATRQPWRGALLSHVMLFLKLISWGILMSSASWPSNKSIWRQCIALYKAGSVDIGGRVPAQGKNWLVGDVGGMFLILLMVQQSG